MVNYTDLFWQVRAELPGVPVPLLYNVYAETVRNFFRRSLAWQVSVPPVDLIANEEFPDLLDSPYEELLPAETYVVQPVRIKYKDGSNVTFRTRTQLDAMDSTWEQDVRSGPTRHWTITAPGVYRLYPIPAESVEAALFMKIAVAPRRNARAVPEPLADEWTQAWTEGALSALLKIPGKDWTDVNLAAAHGRMFDDSVREARSRSNADYGNPTRQVAYGGLSIGGSGRNRSDDYGS
jgi:hypothetical protein